MDLVWMLSAAVGQAEGAPQSAQNPLVAMAPFLVIFFVLYILVIRPQAKKQKQHDEMLQQIKKGDRVLTTGGLYGRIFAVKDDLVVLTVAENVKVEIQKGAITRVAE